PGTVRASAKQTMATIAQGNRQQILERYAADTRAFADSVEHLRNVHADTEAFIKALALQWVRPIVRASIPGSPWISNYVTRPQPSGSDGSASVDRRASLRSSILVSVPALKVSAGT